MYRGNSTSQNNDPSQRDALISVLKKELYDIRDKEHAFISLSDDVNNCESRYSMLKQDKERKQNENIQKIDINRKNIGELRGQADNIKIQNHKLSVHIEDVLRDCAGIKRTAENRQNQIATIMGGNQELQSRNEQVYQQNKSVATKIKNLKEERNKIDNENQRLQLQLQEAINQLKKLEKQARFIESSNSKLTNMLSVAEKDHSDLVYEMRSRDDMVSSTSKKLDQFNKEIEGLKDKIGKLQKQCNKKELQFKNVKDQLDELVVKNKEQAKKIKAGQNNLRGIENELDHAILEKDALENDNAEYNAQHKLLSQEIDNVLLQIIDCERVNTQMKKEIQSYITSDQEARSMLDRKTAMRTMLETVTTRLGQTSSTIAHLR